MGHGELLWEDLSSGMREQQMSQLKGGQIGQAVNSVLCGTGDVFVCVLLELSAHNPPARLPGPGNDAPL